VFHTITVADDRIGALFTFHPEGADSERSVDVDYVLRDIPWPRVNLAEFRIDGTHSNAYAAVGRSMTASVNVAAARRIRAVQELGVAAPIRRNLRIADGRLNLPIRLSRFATALVWVTSYLPGPTAAAVWIQAVAEAGNVLLRWTPSREMSFYSYEVVRITTGSRSVLISPTPLRAATWVDTAPPRGTHVYGVRVVSASGDCSPLAHSPPVSV
jgi:hypothetical protein